MGKLGLSWKKAATISAVVHLIILFVAVIFFVVVPAIQEQETYEVDLTQSLLDDGSGGHAGGGGGSRSDLFPKPLTADEVANRTKAVIANVEPAAATDIPDAVDVPAKASESKNAGETGVAGGEGPGSGGGKGGGHGTGEGTGIGDGRGSGTGSGNGTGQGNGHGSKYAPFDVDGFYNRVDNQKVIPSTYIRRRIAVDDTIVIGLTIDTNGNGYNIHVVSGSDELLIEEAMGAVQRSLPYPNPSGDNQPVNVPVHFYLSASDEEEE